MATKRNQPKVGGERTRSPSPIEPLNEGLYPQSNVQTFIFGSLPQDEKSKFLDFLLNNNVEFNQDPNDGNFIATIKIVNKGNRTDEEQDVINGLD